jgi:hypothetical protein
LIDALRQANREGRSPKRFAQRSALFAECPTQFHAARSPATRRARERLRFFKPIAQRIRIVGVSAHYSFHSILHTFYNG